MRLLWNLLSWSVKHNEFTVKLRKNMKDLEYWLLTLTKQKRKENFHFYNAFLVVHKDDLISVFYTLGIVTFNAFCIWVSHNITVTCYPVFFNGESYQKQKGRGASAQPLFRLRNKFRKIPLCLYLIWPSLMMQYKRLLSYFKNCISKFMQANSSHHKLFHFNFPFFIWKVWKGREKLQKYEYLENKKSFFDEIKNTFHSSGRAIIFCKNKNLIKISGYKL